MTNTSNNEALGENFRVLAIDWGKGIYVLAIDRDSNFLIRLKEALERYKYTVTTKAVNALRLLRETEGYFDLIIGDVVGMPDVDGLKLLEELANFEMEIPVIVLSANGEPEIKQKATDLGAREYIVKPVSFEDLWAINFYVLPKWESANTARTRFNVHSALSEASTSQSAQSSRRPLLLS